MCMYLFQNKRTIVVSARVHPGETNGSWMMKGMIDFLVSDSPDAQVQTQVYKCYYVIVRVQIFNL